MPTHMVNLGPHYGGTLLIHDNDDGSVRFDMAVFGEYGTFFTQPWTHDLNGIPVTQSSPTMETGGRIYTLGTIWVQESQTITVKLPASQVLAEEYEYSFFVQRAGSSGPPSPIKAVRVQVGTTSALAIPYVNDEGEWKTADAFVKHLGEWKSAT